MTLDTSVNIGNIVAIIVAGGSVIAGIIKQLKKADEQGLAITEQGKDIGQVVVKVDKLGLDVQEIKIGAAVTGAKIDTLSSGLNDHGARIRDLERAKG